MDDNDELKISFIDVKWPAGHDHPAVFEKNIRCVFLKDNDGVMFGYNDMKDVLAAYLQDETGVCPDSFDFSISI